MISNLPTSGNEVLYARVPPALKTEVQSHAAKVGLSVNSAVAALLEAGLSASDSEADGLEVELEQLRSEAAGLRLARTQLEQRVTVLGQEKAALAAATEDLARRLGRPIAQCPTCSSEVSGEAVLLEASCPKCGASLLTLFGQDNGKMSQSELVLVMGALGLLLALTLWQARQTSI